MRDLRAPRPATAACRQCDWRYDPMLPGSVPVAQRDAAAKAHIAATGHTVTVSMPGGPGYEVMGPAGAR